MNNQGLILPTVLIFLTIFALLGISALTLSQFQIKMSENTISFAKELQSAEKGLWEAEQNLRNDQLIACLIPFQLKPWQSDQTCQFQSNKLTGHYTVEQMSSNKMFCVVEKDLTWQALYFRITSWIDEANNQPIILQSVFIKAGIQAADKQCTPVLAGRSSWKS